MATLQCLQGTAFIPIPTAIRLRIASDGSRLHMRGVRIFAQSFEIGVAWAEIWEADPARFVVSFPFAILQRSLQSPKAENFSRD